jgi:hypothetical protein
MCIRCNLRLDLQTSIRYIACVVKASPVDADSFGIWLGFANPSWFDVIAHFNGGRYEQSDGVVIFPPQHGRHYEVHLL